MMINERGRTIVLVVDDEEPIRRAVRRMLERNGYHVIEAENGARAVELVADPTIVVDLLLADLEMPELAGEEMARRLRLMRRDVRILYVSGHIERLFSERPMLREGEAFLEKPFTYEGLTEAVSLLLFGTTNRTAITEQGS
jgi:two-component system, cell cycle sensor histidine kinase and response regulator CckA